MTLTPKEKAQELINKFKPFFPFIFECRKCALICVNEILATNPKETFTDSQMTHVEDLSDYWKDVKLEIEKL